MKFCLGPRNIAGFLKKIIYFEITIWNIFWLPICIIISAIRWNTLHFGFLCRHSNKDCDLQEIIAFKILSNIQWQRQGMLNFSESGCHSYSLSVESLSERTIYFPIPIEQ